MTKRLDTGEIETVAAAAAAASPRYLVAVIDDTADPVRIAAAEIDAIKTTADSAVQPGALGGAAYMSTADVEGIIDAKLAPLITALEGINGE